MPSQLPDLYAVLGLPQTATSAEIHARYRKLIKEEHPDRFAGERARAVSEGDPERVRRIDERMALAQQRSRLLNLAHDILGDPRKRQQYDSSQWMRGASGPQRRPSDPPRQAAQPPPRRHNPVQRSASLIFNRTVIDFGTTQRNQQVARVIQVNNLGGIPSDFRVDWAERVPWASFEIYGNPREAFPIAVRVQIDTSGLPYGRHLLELVFTAAGRTTQIPVIVHVQDPARSPVPPNRPPGYSAPRKQHSDRIANLRAASVPVIVSIAAVICQMLVSMADNARNSEPRAVYSTLPVVSELLAVPTRTPQLPTRQPATAKPASPTPRIPPMITPTAKPVQIEMPEGWKMVAAETIADSANWRPTPKTPIDIGEAKLAHQGDIFEWVLPAWVTHEWWLTLNPPGEGEDQMISARIQVISGSPVRYGLVTAYADETHNKIFVVDEAAKTFTISRLFGTVKRQVAGGVLPEGVDPANVWLAVLMEDGRSTFMIDGNAVYQSSLLTTDGRVGFYATVEPYTKVTLSIDNVTIATP